MADVRVMTFVDRTPTVFPRGVAVKAVMRLQVEHRYSRRQMLSAAPGDHKLSLLRNVIK